MQKIVNRIAHISVVSALLSATLLGGGRGQGQSRTSPGSPSRETGGRNESTELRILPDADFKRIEFLERYCFDEVNRERRTNGLPDLRLFDALASVARRYSRRMAEEGFFSHADPRGLTLSFRLAEARVKSSVRAENLSRISGYINPVPEVVRGWMKSPSHRKNILDKEYTHSAIGAWIHSDDVIYFTQIFIR